MTLRSLNTAAPQLAPSGRQAIEDLLASDQLGDPHVFTAADLVDLDRLLAEDDAIRIARHP